MPHTQLMQHFYWGIHGLITLGNRYTSCYATHATYAVFCPIELKLSLNYFTSLQWPLFSKELFRAFSSWLLLVYSLVRCLTLASQQQFQSKKFFSSTSSVCYTTFPPFMSRTLFWRLSHTTFVKCDIYLHFYFLIPSTTCSFHASLTISSYLPVLTCCNLFCS